MREDGQISKRGAIMAQFSRFVRPGYTRLNITATPQNNVLTSAYTGDNKVVIVAVNKNSGTVSQPFTVTGAGSGTVSAYVTDSSRNVAAISGPGMSGGTFTATLPAQSVTTFVVSLTSSGGTPTSLAGTYVITNKNSGLVLDTHNEGTTVGTLVNQNPGDGGSSQTWTLIQAGSDLYKVQSKSSGLFLGITNMSTSNGGTALLWSDNGTADHLWRFVADSGGYYKIVNNNSGLVLGISNMSTSAGASVIQWADNGTADHLWKLTAR
jgi:glucuronoarabinoxylan endo-1,4-beta-xylanase